MSSLSNMLLQATRTAVLLAGFGSALLLSRMPLKAIAQSVARHFGAALQAVIIAMQKCSLQVCKARSKHSSADDTKKSVEKSVHTMQYQLQRQGHHCAALTLHMAASLIDQ